MARSIHKYGLAAAGLLLGGAFVPSLANAAWEPTQPVEIIVPAGTGGGADQMARTIQGIVTKHNLMKQPLVVVNKSGGAGGEGFLDVKNAKGNPHKIIITLSNLFTTPLATGIPFKWKDLTPVAMLALDEFVLWVNAESPYKSVKDYVAAIKGGAGRPVQDGRHRLQAGRPDHHGRARKGDRQEVDLYPVQGRRRGRGAARRQARRFDASTTRSRRSRSGAPARCVRSACSTASSSPTTTRSPATWPGADIPTCKSQGLDVEYLMLRGFFMPPGVTKEQVDYYVDLFKKVRETPEWKELMKNGAFNQTFMTGADYTKWVGNEETRHQGLMKDAGFLAQN